MFSPVQPSHRVHYHLVILDPSLPRVVLATRSINPWVLPLVRSQSDVNPWVAIERFLASCGIDAMPVNESRILGASLPHSDDVHPDVVWHYVVLLSARSTTIPAQFLWADAEALLGTHGRSAIGATTASTATAAALAEHAAQPELTERPERPERSERSERSERNEANELAASQKAARVPKPMYALQRIALKTSLSRVRRPEAPFDSPAQLVAMHAWVNERLAGVNAAISGPVVTKCLSRHDAVLIYPTTRGPMLFTGGSARTPHDVLLVQELHDVMPDNFPALVAWDRARQWWLAETVDGMPLVPSPLAGSTPATPPVPPAGPPSGRVTSSAMLLESADHLARAARMGRPDRPDSRSHDSRGQDDRSHDDRQDRLDRPGRAERHDRAEHPAHLDRVDRAESAARSRAHGPLDQDEQREWFRAVTTLAETQRRALLSPETAKAARDKPFGVFQMKNARDHIARLLKADSTRHWNRRRIELADRLLHNACERLLAHDLPLTWTPLLGAADVLHSPQGLTRFDAFEESYWGPPTLAYELLIEELLRYRAVPQALVLQLRQCYAEGWHGVLRPGEVNRAIVDTQIPARLFRFVGHADRLLRHDGIALPGAFAEAPHPALLEHAQWLASSLPSRLPPAARVPAALVPGRLVARRLRA